MDKPVKGRGRCPRCGSRKVRREPLPATGFYATAIERCLNPACGATWEPMPPGGDHLDDDGTPFAFPDPCDNCAFRPGSPEQSNVEKWKETITSCKAGGVFHCHKGVPIDPESENGFLYPQRRDLAASALAGQPVMVSDRRRLRICRGYLNMISRHWQKGAGE